MEPLEKVDRLCLGARIKYQKRGEKMNRKLDPPLSEMVAKICQAGSPEKIILFGSRARGDARADSDIDLLVIEASNLPRYKRAARYRKAVAGLCVAKDIVVWSPEEILEWQSVPNAFITTVLREGRVLYEA